MPTTTTTTTSNVAVHTISFRGKAGAIFVLLSSAIILYLIGFVSHGWAFKEKLREGLWEECKCDPVGKTEPKGDWHTGVQAMISIGLLGLLLAFLLISIYMCVHTVSKNSTIVALVCVCFIAVLFMAVGFILYAIEQSNYNFTLSWSFVITIIASLLCLFAGILSVVQLRSSGVRI